MGGIGSGSWYRWQVKKATVEEALTLSMRSIRPHLSRGFSGLLIKSEVGPKGPFFRFEIAGDIEPQELLLQYNLHGREMHLSIRLTTTPTQFGGKRWWFLCPLIAMGIGCTQRANKLYLPPGAKYFGCRICHDLTYRSCQEAHQDERFFKRVGMDAETINAWKSMRGRW